MSSHFSAIFDWIFFIFAGNENMHKSMSQKSRAYRFAIDFWMLPRYIPEHFGIFRSLTTVGDNRDRCQDTRLGQ